jgi:hypothetical protein
MEILNYEAYSNKVLMIEPTDFGTNYETKRDNAFMKDIINDVQPKAFEEFKNFVLNLTNKNIEVLIYKQPCPEAKDAIFPNNWFSTHRNVNFPEGLLIIYPLKNQSRRIEKNPIIIEELKANYKYFIDLSFLEKEEEFLESTGSLIFDNLNNKIYCGVSERATNKALDVFIENFNKISQNSYNLIRFKAQDSNENTIYHTNVIMSVLEKHIIICSESIKNDDERRMVLDSIRISKGKQLMEVTNKEMINFGCNIINVKPKNKNYKTILILSKTAFEILNCKIINEFKNEYDLCVNDISTIEEVGGGSCRCMIAEIF